MPWGLVSGRYAVLAGLLLGAFFLAAGLGAVKEPLASESDEGNQPWLARKTQPMPALRVPETDGHFSGPATFADRAGRPVESDLLRKVLEGSALSESWLEAHGFVPGSMALQRLHGLMLGHVSLPDSETSKKIMFGPSGGTSVLAEDASPVLAQQERYIQAVMTPDGLKGDSMLLRWRNASDNVVIELSAQAISANANEPIPVWKYTAEDWPPGRYRVEVISPDGDLTVLAVGEFEIAVPNTPTTPFLWTAVAQH